jgi:opacity protein-like surface antigen
MFRRFGFLLVAALFAAVPAAAQDEKPVQLNIGGGYTGIYGAAADHIGNGGNFTLGVIFNVKPTIGIQGEYGWNGIGKKQLSLPVFPSPVGGTGVPTDFFADGNMQYGDANVLFHPSVSSKAKPYVLAGLGVYYRPVNVTTPGVGYTTICDPYWYVCYPTLVPVDQVVGSRSSTDFGMNFGGGVNYKLTDSASIYFEVRYHYVWGPSIEPTVNPLTGQQVGKQTANGQFLPITVGFRF